MQLFLRGVAALFLFYFSGVIQVSADLYLGHPDERLVFSTDRGLYIAGEEVMLSFQMVSQGAGKGRHSRIGYLVLRNAQQQPIDYMMVMLEDDSFATSMYLPDTLSTGYYQLIAYTNHMRRFGEPHFFDKQILVVNRFDTSLTALVELEEVPSYSLTEVEAEPHVLIALDKDLYKPYDTIALTISNASEPGREIIASVSVVPQEASGLFADGDVSAVSSLTNLGINDFDDTKAQSALSGGDNTQNMPADRVFIREKDRLSLTGKLIDQRNGLPVSGARVFLSTPDSLVNLMFATTNNKGIFGFNMPLAYAGREIYLFCDADKFEGDGKLYVDDKTALNNRFVPKAVALSDRQIEYIKRSQEVVRVQKTYTPLTVEKCPPKLPVSGLSRVYSEPSNLYRLSDYERMLDLREISSEIIPYLRMRWRGDDLHIQMYNGHTSYGFFDQPPFVFLNGMPIADVRPIVFLGTDAIDRIELQTLPWHHGQLFFHGILSVFLRQNQRVEDFLPKGVVQVDLDPFAFHAKYAGDDMHERAMQLKNPDFRQLLFWEPLTMIDQPQTFVFTSGGLRGDYVVIVESINGDGQRNITARPFSIK